MKHVILNVNYSNIHWLQPSDKKDAQYNMSVWNVLEKKLKIFKMEIK